MARRTANSNDEEPEQTSFQKPSEKEHLLQVTDVYELGDCPEKLNITDPDIVLAKLEVVGGEEEGRTMLHRMNINDTGKGFWATRLFLKAIGSAYKGLNFLVDTEEWPGKQFYATVKHNDGYANIDEFNFEKLVEKAAEVEGSEGTPEGW